MNPRDPRNPQALFIPETLLERARTVPIEKADPDGRYMPEVKLHVETTLSGLNDFLERKQRILERLDDNLREAAGAKPNEGSQHHLDTIYLIEGIRLTGEALESATEMNILRYKIQVLALAYQNAHQAMTELMNRSNDPLLEFAQQHGMEEGKFAILNNIITPFNPDEVPLSEQTGASA
jgi:hypothetical protein